MFLYVDDPGLTFQHKDVHTIEHQLNKDFANLCEWFVDNKLIIHLGEGKTKCILFGSKLKLKNAGKLNIMYNGIEIKQYSKLAYLGCLLDDTMSEESMACVISIVFKFINSNYPYYLNEAFEFTPEGNFSLRNNFLKLKRPFRNTNAG